MSENTFDPGTLLTAFGETLLGLDAGGTIRVAAGAIENSTGLKPDALIGLTWNELIARITNVPHRQGLDYARQAIAHGYVAATHWPPYVPFSSFVVARLRPVETDGDVALGVHLIHGVESRLVGLLGQPVSNALHRLISLTQDIYRGTAGPLTDLQVHEVGSLASHAEHITQFIYDMHAQIAAPAAAAPLPHRLSDLLTFSERDFTNRRIVTHQLKVSCDWSPGVVYCHAAIRQAVHRILEMLFAGIEGQSTIVLTDHPTDSGSTVRVTIAYRSQEPTLRVTEQILPLLLENPERFELSQRPIVDLITSVQASLAPVNGAISVEPSLENHAFAQFVLELPRWTGPVN